MQVTRIEHPPKSKRGRIQAHIARPPRGPQRHPAKARKHLYTQGQALQHVRSQNIGLEPGPTSSSSQDAQPRNRAQQRKKTWGQEGKPDNGTISTVNDPQRDRAHPTRSQGKDPVHPRTDPHKLISRSTDGQVAHMHLKTLDGDDLPHLALGQAQEIAKMDEATHQPQQAAARWGDTSTREVINITGQDPQGDRGRRGKRRQQGLDVAVRTQAR